MGRLGASMAETLDSLGHEVLGIDTNEDLVQDLSIRMPNVHLVVADATEASTLRDLGLENFDGAAVVIGENMQASILVTLILKDLGLPLVIARAATKHHSRVLEKVGADRIIQPEVEMGIQMARTLASPIVLDYVDLGEDEALVEVEVPEKWVGKTLSDLHLYRRSGLTVIALKPKASGGTIPTGDTVLNEGDVLIIGGKQEDLDRSELYQT
jgi:trk system potassium uptake protein TrkA